MLVFPASAVTFVPVSKVNGRAEVDDILAAVRPATCLVTIMLANNETGVVMVSRLAPRRPGGALTPPAGTLFPPPRPPRCSARLSRPVPVPVPRLASSKRRPQPFLSPLQPIPELGQRVRALNQQRAAAGLPPILLHTDAAQALGKRRVDVADLTVDFLTIVGHKVRPQSPEHGWHSPVTQGLRGPGPGTR